MILSRAIVLGVLAAFVTIGYIAVVVAIGAVCRRLCCIFLHRPSLAVPRSVAVAFQPLRRHCPGRP